MAHYVDPSTEIMGNGRSMGDVMRRGASGLRGVVVAKATPGGLPVNYDPHNRAHLEIHVEPDNENSTLTMDRITKTAVDAALAAANDQVPGDDIDSIRERAAVAFEKLAKMQGSGVVARTIGAFKTAQSPQADLRADLRRATAAIYHDNGERPPADDYFNNRARDEEETTLAELREEAAALAAVSTAPPIDKIDRAYSPMAAFGLKKTQMAPPVNEHRATSGYATASPEKLVYFEKEGIGTVPAFFHDILVQVARPEPDSPEEVGFIVLVYDVRCAMAKARWFPPSNDPYGRPWAAKISDDNRLYLVHTTGFQYIYDSREYCVLRVEKAIWAPAGGE